MKILRFTLPVSDHKTIIVKDESLQWLTVQDSGVLQTSTVFLKILSKNHQRSTLIVTFIK